MSESDAEFVERYAQSHGWAVPDRLLSLARKGAEADALRAKVERLEGALNKISEYEIEEGCPCNACQHSVIASAALGDTHE